MKNRILPQVCLIVLCGCSNEEGQATITSIEDTDTKYAIVDSTTDYSVVITFEEEDSTGRTEDKQTYSYHSFDDIPVLKNGCTISIEELEPEDELRIIYYEDSIHAIQVIDSKKQDKQNASSNSKESSDLSKSTLIEEP